MTTTAPPPEGFAIRQAERADLLSVVRIEKQSFPQPWPFRAFERFLDEPGFLIATAGPNVVGYVVADTVPNHGRAIGHVKDIAVAPDARGQGVGSRLLRRALGVLATQGAGRVKLEVRATNEGAIRLYRRFGFAVDRRVPRYYDDGEDALVMTADAEAALERSGR